MKKILFLLLLVSTSTFAQIEHGLLEVPVLDFLYKIVGNELLGVMNQIGLIGTIIS